MVNVPFRGTVLFELRTAAVVRVRARAVRANATTAVMGIFRNFISESLTIISRVSSINKH